MQGWLMVDQIFVRVFIPDYNGVLKTRGSGVCTPPRSRKEPVQKSQVHILHWKRVKGS